MPDILHRIGIAASPAMVYESVATRAGLKSWWTQGVAGETVEGGRLEFSFGGPEPAAVMEVTRLVPDQLVTWRCVDGPDEWVGTELTFAISRDADETVLLFSHAHWRQQVEFMAHCSTKWGSFLVGMKRGLESGKATPYPEDEPVSNWG
jgi:uncharacterized protein YndB with AHSA1/START domain